MCPARIQLQRCDIVSLQADVCVSSIHRSKDMNMGLLSKHILSSAGKSIQDEMNMKQPGKELEMGQVEYVSPGKLRNKFKKLMFICLRQYIPDNEKILLQSILECLELAATKPSATEPYKSISFPALGTGQGYPAEKVATCLLEAVVMHNYQYPETSLETVYIVLLDEDIELIKVFLLMCVNGTTDMQTDKTKQSTSDNFFVGDLASGLSFDDGKNCYGTDNSATGSTTPPTKQKPHMPKATTQKKKAGPQKTANPPNVFSYLFSSFFSHINNRSLSAQYSQFRVAVQPQISTKKIGLQLNFDVDISFLEQFIPTSLRTSFDKMFN
uniref:Macro domain-containing protein n=1 Tax=Arion vulgaris TaxID=1028688 RepID=A0A0B7B2P6_9EUPU